MNGGWLLARVRRSGGVRVAVPLGVDGETVFLDGEAPAPVGGPRIVLEPDDRGRPRREPGPEAPEGAHALVELLHLLWPGGVRELQPRLQCTLERDNRLDLESDLRHWADLLDGLCGWWQTLDPRFLDERRAALIQCWPALLELLDRPLPEGVFERALRGGGPLREEFEGLFGAPVEALAEPDEEAWRGWTERETDEIFGPRGGLARLLGEGYEPRQGQLDMAERVGKVLERREHLMVEAGTGIGKSLAYLVPALLRGARQGERVVVSTWTKALQEQLVEHDLPLLAKLGYPGRARLLLGRNNYLCRRQLRRALVTPARGREEAAAQLALGLWARQSREGRREELADHPWMEPWWRRFFESVEPCSPHICHRDPVCFVVRARRVAREAEVVVVNHSLLMMDLKSAQSLMGPSQLLVVDEAHQLSEVATRALSLWISRERLDVYRNLVGERPRPKQPREVLGQLMRAAREGPEEAEVRDAALACDRALEAHLAAFLRWYDGVEDEARRRLGEGHGRPGSHRIHDGDEAFGPVREESGALLDAAEGLDRALAKLLAATSSLEESGAKVGEEREGLASLLSFHREFTDGLRFCLAADDEDWVYWVEWGGERGLAGIVAAPLTVEAPLGELWDTHYRSVIMTSATLAVEDDFTPFAEGVGFTRVSHFTDTLLVPSPFDHEHQALLLTAGDLPLPDAPDFAPRLAPVLAAIALGVPTKMLVLSTSYKLVEQLEQSLEPLLVEPGEDLFERGRDPVRPLLLVQRPGGSRVQLADRFRRAEAALLLATGSFWEGVDFPGRELEVLVVPRLPFGVPTEPIAQGRTERARRLGRDPFQAVTLADAVLRLKQGVGRLLRSSEDRGAVLLLDPRLQTKAYGVVFLNSMPRTCELVPQLEDVPGRVLEFLRRSRAARSSQGSAEGL